MTNAPSNYNEVSRIKDILKKVRKIEITTRKQAQEMLSGHYRSVFKGRGIEFSEVRDYIFGDSIKQIEWNVTARMAKPFVKQFVEERELNIILAVDVSPSMYYSSFPEALSPLFPLRNMKIDIACEISAAIAVSAGMNNDKVGLVMFNDSIQKYIPQKKNKDQPMRIIRELVGHRPAASIADIRGVLRYIMNTQKKRGVLFILSDFDNIEDCKEFSIARKKFDIIPISINDDKEFELPDLGFIEIFDPETQERPLLDTGNKKVREAYRRAALEKRNMRDRIFKKNGIDHIEILTRTDYMPVLMRFFRKREKIIPV